MCLKPIPTPEPLSRYFKALNIDATTWAHRPVFTVQEGTDIKAALPGGHIKNLFLKDKKGKLWLIVAADSTRIELKHLHKDIDGCARLSFGNPERLQDVLGVTPGSVTPLALINDTDRQVTVILDAALLRYDFLNCHPLINDKTTTLRRQDLQKFITSLGYTPLIIDFEAHTAISTAGNK